MRITYIICFMLLGAVANAQVTTYVYWTAQSSLKPKDVIYYSPKLPLVWSDFQGVPQPLKDAAALTASGFGYSASVSSGDAGTVIDVQVYCYFAKPASWVKKGYENDYILKHEQNHFDISFIAANSFVQKLKEQKFTLQNFNAIVGKIYKESNLLMTVMQEQYDSETRHGLNKEMQAFWQTKIAGLLK